MSGEARFAALRALPGLGEPAPGRLRDARVHVVGAGPLAGPALLALAQAGVGTIYVDDGDDVEPGDAAGWLLPPDAAGTPRLLGALGALRAASAAVEPRPYATGTSPSATLVCAATEALAHVAADRARRAGLAHVVALGDGDGGEVVTIPSGAPCLACAARPAARVRPSAAAVGALGTLAALELVLVVTRLVPRGAGRRIVLEAGVPRAEATVRRPGCECRIVY